ncbi:MAG TPA: hypothetical protein DCQ32_02310 [Cyanobacteria bacterium UBA8156]|nr:hypothetical protein [Cyanobacteria bacterium UBA8156]
MDLPKDELDNRKILLKVERKAKQLDVTFFVPCSYLTGPAPTRCLCKEMLTGATFGGWAAGFRSW